MTIEAWMSFAATVGTAVASGFAVWMFRIDRSIQAMTHLAESLHELKDSSQKECEHIWNRLDNHSGILTNHGERLSTMEAIKRGV